MHRKKVVCAKPQQRTVKKKAIFPVLGFSFPNLVGSAVPAKNEHGQETGCELREKMALNKEFGKEYPRHRPHSCVNYPHNPACLSLNHSTQPARLQALAELRQEGTGACGGK